MSETLFVRTNERPYDGHHQLHGAAGREPAAPRLLPQGPSLEVFEHHVRNAVVLVDLVNDHDVLVVARRGRPSLAQEGLGQRGGSAQQELDRHPPAETRVARQVDRPHPAATELADDFVPANSRAGVQRGRILRLGRWSRKLSALAACLLLALLLRSANAAPAEPAENATRPWAENVAQEQQDEALRLFEEGNKLFGDSKYTAAVAVYREALKSWDHPAIRYNLATALIELDQPLGAYESLELALRYGAAPFTPENYQQALTYRKLLRGQLAELRVACQEPNAEVTLDGRAMFSGPGDATRFLLPGAHQLVARKAGYLTETRSLSMLPGKPVVEELSLQEQPVPTKIIRRWETWKPWAVLGAGAVLAVAGVPMILDAKKNIDAFDADVARSCPMGCTAVPPGAVGARDRSHVESVVAVSLFTVGGAMLAGGAAMLILNQPRVVPDESASRAGIAPMVGRGSFGLSLSLVH